MDGIAERHEQGLLVLSPSHGRASRRVLFVNCYGGKSLLEKIKSGNTPPHHLWGCLELARMGYEVAIAEPVTDFYFSRNPFPHDLRLLRFTQAWLGRDGIIYCGHNVLYWLPFLRKLGAVRCPIVSLLYGREPLNFSRVHSGIIALNGAAADHARKLAPRTKVARLSWGGDLDYFPRLPYAPRWFLSCGITNRDFPTLCRAASKSKQPIRVICPGLPEHLVWPANVEIIDGGRGWNVDEKKISYRQLLHDHYAQNAGSLIILDEDTREYTGCGFTNLIEAMAMSRPVIITRTGALPTEIDVERAGCGLFVRPGDADALAGAIEALGREPARAALMGQKGRQLAEEHYNIQRYARDLHTFFESL
jgi:glycosyltransferase involved in cell wall biosynthesis